MTEADMELAIQGLETKSAKIRHLAKLGATRSEIANYLNIRYQHVRNVLIAPEPLRKWKRTVEPETSIADVAGDVRTLSIEEAKRGLARQFGVSPEKIEIIIRG